MHKKLLLAVSLLLLPLFAQAQHPIKGTFTPEDGYTFVILYRIAPDNVFYVADSNIGEDGSFNLEPKEELPPSMYRLVYNLPQDQHFFDFIYNGKEALDFTFSNENGLGFTTSEENKIWQEFQSKGAYYDIEIGAILASANPELKKLNTLLKDQKNWYTELLSKANGLIVEQFLTAGKPYLTKKATSPEVYIETAKKTYFANFDFSNPTLQQSSYPLERVIKYVFLFTDTKNKKDSQMANVDVVGALIKTTNATYQKALLESAWHFLVLNEQVDLANHLAIQHLIPIAKEVQDTSLASELMQYKSLSLGAKAPDFSWKEEVGGKTKTLHLQGLEGAENYILVFWSSTCSHCLKEVPKIHSQLKAHGPEKYRVIAIGLEDEPYDWKNMTYDLPDFTHVLGLGKWDNEIGNTYAVTATPTYFVLDSEKRIVQKPETFEELIGLLTLDK